MSPSLTLLIFLSLLHAAASFNFDLFPVCAQPYLYNTAPDECDSTDLAATNKCLCGNEDWLNLVAQSIRSHCGCSTLINSASVLESACYLSNTPAVLTQGQLVNAGQGDCLGPSAGSGDITTSPAVSSTNPSSSTASGSGGSQDQGSSGMSSSDKIQLGLGLGIGLPTLIFTAWGLWYMREKRAKRKRASVMAMSQYNGSLYSG